MTWEDNYLFLRTPLLSQYLDLGVCTWVLLRSSRADIDKPCTLNRKGSDVFDFQCFRLNDSPSGIPLQVFSLRSHLAL
jgi:hypothetical protein